MSSAGTGVEKLTAAWQNLKQYASEKVTLTVETAIQNSKGGLVGQAVDAAGSGDPSSAAKLLAVAYANEWTKLLTTVINPSMAGTMYGPAGPTDFAGKFPKAGNMKDWTPPPDYGAITGGGGDVGMAGLGVYGVPRPDYNPNKRYAPSYLFPDAAGHEDSYNAAVLAERRRPAIALETRLHGEGERQAGETYTASEKQAYLNSLIDKGRGLYDAMAGAAQKVVDPIMQASKAEIERANAMRSVNARFGVTGADGLTAEISGGMDSDVAAQRKLLASGGASKAKLEAFDANSKAAMDDYAVATGAATKESIKFRDMAAEIHKNAATGKITITEEARELQALAKAAQNGTISLTELAGLQERLKTSPLLGGLQNIGKGILGNIDWLAGGNFPGGTPTGKTKDPLGSFMNSLGLGDLPKDDGKGVKGDPYGPATKGAKDLTTAQDLAATSSSNMANTMFDSGQRAAASFNPWLGVMTDAQRQIDNLMKSLWGAAGQLSIHVGFTGDGGDSRGSVRPSRGPQ